jgi:hypothetical protein
MVAVIVDPRAYSCRKPLKNNGKANISRSPCQRKAGFYPFGAFAATTPPRRTLPLR